MIYVSMNSSVLLKLIAKKQPIEKFKSLEKCSKRKETIQTNLDQTLMCSSELKKLKRHRKVACIRCSSRKVKCSGNRPSCEACITSNNACIFPVKIKKSLLVKKMEGRIRELEAECLLLRRFQVTGMVENAKAPHLCLVKERSKNDDPGISETAFPITEPILLGDQNYGSILPVSPPNLLENSSCEVFIGALQCHLIKHTMGTGHSSDLSVKCAQYSQNEKKFTVSRLYLDDEVLHSTSYHRAMVLPDKSYTLRVVKKVFRFFAQEYGLFSIADFESRLEETYRSFETQSHSWVAFLCITLAVGEQYINEPSKKQDVPGMNYFLMTFNFFREPIEEPNLDTVRVLLLIAFYYQGLNRMNSVFMYTGLAVSTAMILGFHRRSNNDGLLELENESRKKLWWTAFIMDSLWALRIGLPSHINTEEMDVDFPNKIVKKQDGFDPKYLIANAQLALCAESAMKEIYGVSRHESTLRNIKSSVGRLEAFFEALCPELKVVPEKVTEIRCTENLHLRYHQMVIFCVRPLFISLINGDKFYDNNIDELKLKGIDSALLTVNILSTLSHSGWFSDVGFLEAQCCFSSILILIMEALNGKKFPELRTALSLNKVMCDAGNITAICNNKRLKHLDKLLFEAEKQFANDMKTSKLSKCSINKVENKNAAELNFLQPLVSPEDKDKQKKDWSGSPHSECEWNLPFLKALENVIVSKKYLANTLNDLSMTFQEWEGKSDHFEGTFSQIYRDFLPP